MRKLYALLASVLIILSLTACSSSEESGVYTVMSGSTEYTIDQINNTISDGENTYQYTITGDSEAYSIKIEYPNGATYTWNMQFRDGMGSGTGDSSSNYDAEKYTDGWTLSNILEDEVPEKKAAKNFFVIIVLLVFGIIDAAVPEIGWYLGYGWRYKNAEPSKAALIAGRISGILLIVIAISLLFA